MVPNLRFRRRRRVPLTQLLEEGLREKPSDRPTATEMAEGLEAIANKVRRAQRQDLFVKDLRAPLLEKAKSVNTELGALYYDFPVQHSRTDSRRRNFFLTKIIK